MSQHNTEAQELLPCPFCGGDAKTHGPYGWYSQWCISHSCKTFYTGAQDAFKDYPSETSAITAWNTRSNLPAARPDWCPEGFVPLEQFNREQFGSPDARAEGEGRADDFNGDNAHLVRSIDALLDLADAKALVPHGMDKGSHAYRLLVASRHRLPYFDKDRELENPPGETTRSGEGGQAGEGFQAGVDKWMDACFGEAIKADQLERGDRFCEEALELCQTMPGFTADRAHALVDYVFSRDVGDRYQEVGGVMVTLAALCNTVGLSINEEATRELMRVWTKVDAIRAKQAAKPTGSALPVATALTRSSDGVGEPVAWLYSSDDGSRELMLDCNHERARRLLEMGWTEQPLFAAPPPDTGLVEAISPDARLVEALRELSDILENAPELNPSNYDHEQVCELNAKMVEACLFARAALAAHQQAQSAGGDL